MICFQGRRSFVACPWLSYSAPLALAVPLPRGDNGTGADLKSINVSRGVLIRKWAAVG